MRYIKTFTQEDRRYSEEISEEQFKFYTSPNYKTGDPSHKIFSIIEEDKPVVNPDEEQLQSEIIIDDNGAKEVYTIKRRSPEEIQRIQEDKRAQERRMLESFTLISFKSNSFKIDDKTISMLQGYILSSTQQTTWKSETGFVELTLSDMQVLLGLIMQKKNELFAQEQSLQ